MISSVAEDSAIQLKTMTDAISIEEKRLLIVGQYY
jgi:hypothetical protein